MQLKVQGIVPNVLVILLRCGDVVGDVNSVVSLCLLTGLSHRPILPALCHKTLCDDARADSNLTAGGGVTNELRIKRQVSFHTSFVLRKFRCAVLL